MAPIASNTSALLALRCPRCHEGKIFTSRALSFKFADMPEVCPVCGQPTEPEPGFYYGAMFVSYAFSVAIFAVTAVALYFLAGDPAIWVYVVVVASVKSLVQRLNELIPSAALPLEIVQPESRRASLYSETSVLLYKTANHLPSGQLAPKAADLVQKTCSAIKVHKRVPS
jgi:uncharacterized protein (DUF983 family)